MAVKTIAELSLINRLNDTDVFVIDDGSANYKIQWSALKLLLGSVSSFTANNETGVLSLTLTNGTILSVTPHDPTKQNKLTFDETPTADSDNPVKSGGVKTELDKKLNSADYKQFTGATSEHAGTAGFVPAPPSTGRYLGSQGVWEEPDTTPTANSEQLITSGAVKAALALLGDPVTIGHGGTGLTASPSLLVNLAATAAANVLQASPRPGVTGILSLEHGGTGKNSQDGLISVVAYGNAGAHNMIYRGKYLGTYVTTAQWNAIGAGTFEDLYIGDYWTINGVNWRIAAFDYYYNMGDTACTTHHVVIVPDSNLYSHVMNDTNITTGAYVGSKMYTEGLAQAKTAINNAFGSSHILTHRTYLKNAVASGGYESGGAWYDSTVELMTEQNVYGCRVFGNCLNGTNIPASYTIDKTQFPLFALNHLHTCNRGWYWLRDVVSAAGFAIVSGNGRADCGHASDSVGVRPAFSIKKS